MIVNYIKRRWGRIGIVIIGICALLGAERGCCPSCPSAPEDVTKIFIVDNEHVYYTYSNDTLWVRFQYRMKGDLKDSFDYALVYFYGIQSWKSFPQPGPNSPILSDDTIRLPKDSFPIGPMGRRDSLYFTGWASPDSYDIYYGLSVGNNILVGEAVRPSLNKRVKNQRRFMVLVEDN